MTILPNMNSCATGIRSNESISTKFENPVGFSNGTAALAL
jgi:hypothetical protein